MVRLALTAIAILPGQAIVYAEISATSAAVRRDNSLIVDVQVSAAGSAAQVSVTYQAPGVDPLVSPFTPLPTNGRATITIGRLRANTSYTYTVEAIDDSGGPAGTAGGSFTTGPLPAALAMSTFTLTGRTTAPLVILPLLIGGAAEFRGYAALDLHAPDAPQIVWYYLNAPSTASGILHVDAVGAITREQNGNFLFADAGSGPPPAAADGFLREIAPDGSLLAASPVDCSITPPPGGTPAPGWVWGQGNDIPEQLLPGADGVPGTVLHLGKIVRDPFFDAGLAPPGARLQVGATIRRWDPSAGTDEVVWDPFAFLDPLAERTDAGSDPGANSASGVAMHCAATVLQGEDWMHANSLQVTPAGALLMSIRHLDTVIAISPQFDRIEWRIGGPRSDFAFPDPADKFYHQHYVRMLDNGNLLVFDNGNSRPAEDGGRYSRALELALDWDSMTAVKVWEYRHPLGADGTYKYADKVGSADRLANGNTLVLFGADIDPATRAVKDPQTFTLVEAGPDGEALAVLDMNFPGNFPVYRALPLETLFGELPAGDALAAPEGGQQRPAGRIATR